MVDDSSCFDFHCSQRKAATVCHHSTPFECTFRPSGQGSERDCAAETSSGGTDGHVRRHAVDSHYISAGHIPHFLPHGAGLAGKRQGWHRAFIAAIEGALIGGQPLRALCSTSHSGFPLGYLRASSTGPRLDEREEFRYVFRDLTFISQIQSEGIIEFKRINNLRINSLVTEFK